VTHGPSIPGSRVNGWQALAIIALIAATAGWTAAILLATRSTSSPPPVAAASPTDSFEPEPSDDGTLPPVADTHDAPELEALLPTKLGDTTLQVQSWTGDTILTDDAWSTSVTSFLTGVGKEPKDLRVAQAYDPDQTVDGSIGVYHVDGLDPKSVHDALLAAWKVDYPDMVVTTTTMAGQQVTKADFGEDTVASYLVIRGDLLYDIETNDPEVAAAAVAALPPPGKTPSGAPRSAAPSVASPKASASAGG